MTLCSVLLQCVDARSDTEASSQCITDSTRRSPDDAVMDGERVQHVFEAVESQCSSYTVDISPARQRC